MFDIGASELLVIGVVALVVIGPKELPGVLRTVGKTVGKVRQMAGEFQSQFSEAMREAEMDEARKKVAEIGASVKSALDTDTPAPSASTHSVASEAEINAASIPDLAPPLPEPAHPSHEAIMAELSTPAASTSAGETPAAVTPPLNESAPPKAAGQA